jgi:FkbM family methyltransferase
LANALPGASTARRFARAGSSALPAVALRVARFVVSRPSATRLRVRTRFEQLRERRAPACLNAFERSIFSRHGEDGVIEEIFRRIGTTNRYCVEIGCGDGSRCNSRRLVEAGGWTGLLLEENPHDARFAAARFRAQPARALCARTQTANVDALLAAQEVPSRIDLLSIEIEGNDYWIWQSLTTTRARVVCIEYNASHPPWKSWIMPYDPNHRWIGDRHYGASLRALSALANAMGYSLVGCDRKGVSAFFVEDDLLADHFDRPKDVSFHYRCPKYAFPWFGYRRTASRQLHLRRFVEHTGGYPLLRPNTMDAEIWGSVARDYAAAPRRFSAADTVIDIGCHVGAFSALAAMRGAGKVLAFEANRENFEIASENLKPFPQCEVKHAAVWRSDLPQREPLRFTPSTDPTNTGGGSVLFEHVEESRRFGGRVVAAAGAATPPIAPSSLERGARDAAPQLATHAVASVALDEILEGLPRVRCLKIDVEGSEFPILLTATRLDRVDEIVGEFHECAEDEESLFRDSASVGTAGFRIERLAAALRTWDFFVICRRTHPRSGTFYACRGDSLRSRVGKTLALYGISGSRY